MLSVALLRRQRAFENLAPPVSAFAQTRAKLSAPKASQDGGAIMRIWKKIILVGAAGWACAALAGCGGEPAPSESAAVSGANENPPIHSVTDEFRQMADRHAAEFLKTSPELATILGVGEEIAGEGYQARLGAYGFEANQRLRVMNESFLQEIRAVERGALDEQAATTYDVMRKAYEIGARRNQFAFGASAAWGATGPYAVTQLDGPHIFLPRLLHTQHALATKKDAEDYLSRLSEFGRVFDETIESLGGDAALGVVPPRFAIEGAQRSIALFMEDPPEQNPLVASFAARLEQIGALTPDERTVLGGRAAGLVETVVYPAYERLFAALGAIAAQAGDDAGLWRLGEDGEAFYNLALASYGAGAMNAEDIHALGLAEVDRITAEMDAILRAEGLTEGSAAERFAALGAREDLRYPNTDEGRAALLADLNAQIAGVAERAPAWFGATPGQDVEIRRIPVHEQDSSPGGYYSSPPLDGSRPGVYWINLKDTADWPKHRLKTLTYHEAVPGHHFQRSLERAAALPLMRNVLAFPEFAEGWALYAEQLAAEMGMYENDPLGNLGRLQAELFRAARLVADSGLHHKRWTREQVIDYLVETAGETRASATREAERYAVWPGQACSYKLGMLKINELRARAEDALGENFDPRAFHDEILSSGTVPLPVLEAKIGRWIRAQGG
jgi:uncharacterized protein (DUF885 family)